MKDRWTTHLATLLILCSFIGSHAACENVGSSGLRFEITIPSSVRDEPVTGRLFVAISPDGASYRHVQLHTPSGRSRPFLRRRCPSTRGGRHRGGRRFVGRLSARESRCFAGR